MKFNNILWWSLLVILLFPTLAVHAQDNRQSIVIQGVVLDKTDSAALQFINIFNLSTHTGTISGTDGGFYLTVAKGDTVRITSVGYQDYFIYTDLNTSTQPIKVFMSKKTYQLQPVIIGSRHKFGKSFLDKIRPAPYNDVNLAKPPKPVDLGDTKAAPLNGLSIGWDPVLNNIRRQTSEIRRWQARERYLAYIASRYNKNLVRSYTGLSEIEAESLMRFCQLPNEFVITATDYEIGLAIKQCYTSFAGHQPVEDTYSRSTITPPSTLSH